MKKTPSANEKNFLASLGAGAIVTCRDHVALVRLNYSGNRGRWVLPGGMLQRNEHPTDGALREVYEETGLRIILNGLLAVRHRILVDGTANVYWVFSAKLSPGHCTGTLPDLAWPKTELMEARFWPLKQAIHAEEVMANTRKFISLSCQIREQQPMQVVGGMDGRYDDELYI